MVALIVLKLVLQCLPLVYNLHVEKSFDSIEKYPDNI